MFREIKGKPLILLNCGNESWECVKITILLVFRIEEVDPFSFCACLTFGLIPILGWRILSITKDGNGKKAMKKIVFLAVIVIAFFISKIEPAENRPFIQLKKVSISRMPDDLTATTLIRHVTFDDQGNAFIVDSRKCQVIKLDPDLKFVKAFGRRGQGPGEFTYPDCASVDEKGDLYILNMMPGRFLHFDNDGNYIDEIKLTLSCQFMMDVFIVSRNVAVGRCNRREGEHNGVIFQLNPQKAIREFPMDGHSVRMKSGESGLVSLGPHEGIDDHSTILSENGKILSMDCQSYRFSLFNSSGDILFEVKRPDIKRRKLSYAEIASFRKKGEASIKKNPTVGKLIDALEYKNVLETARISGDKIVIFLVRDDLSKVSGFPADIYDFKGKLVKKVQFKVIPDYMWENCAYFIVPDNEDNMKILKYEMIW